MTFRLVSSDVVLAALGDGGEDPLLRRCVAGLRAYPRDSYAIGGTPAQDLRRQLEIKYRHAAARGKLLTGDQELLLRLHERGNDPIAGVSAHGSGEHFFIYLDSHTLEPVGAAIMLDAERE